jgi:hypothetical protein
MAPHHDHDHDHDHAASGVGSGDYVPGHFEMLEMSIGELLVERGRIGAGEIRRQIEVLDSRTPALGAKVVARAWVDGEFKKRLLADGRAACEELGISFYDDTGLIVLENTDRVHNLVVCTLCSCARGHRAARSPGGVRDHHCGRRGNTRQRFHGAGSISGLAEAAKRLRKFQRGAARRSGDPRLHDRGHPG